MKLKRCNGITQKGTRCKRKAYRRNCGGHISRRRRKNPRGTLRRRRRRNPTFHETINKKTGIRRYYVDGRRVSRDVFEQRKWGLRLSCFTSRTKGNLVRLECFGMGRRKRRKRRRR